MISSWPAMAMAVAVVVAAGTGCQSTAGARRLSAGDEEFSFFGPGRERLDFGRLPVIRFIPGSWRLPDEEAGRLQAVAEVIAGGGRVLIVGVGDDGVPAEHGRQQAMARALVVRRALERQGADPARVLVTGVAAEESIGLTGRTETGPRAECGMIR